MAQAESRYKVIWIKLKKEGTVKLAAPSSHHARLRKAIIKRKDLDLGFKLEVSENNKRSYLRFKRQENMMTVTLHIVTRSDWL